MAALAYTLCALTSLACFVLLLRGWRASGHRILFWSALCFAGMTANNFVLVLDKLVFTEADLSTLRLAMALVSVLLLVFGLVWEEE
jgi:hypothetical protein